MKVVVDANVFVSAAIRTGPAHRVIQAWLERHAFELVICPRLLTEVREVLMERPRMRRWIDRSTAARYVETIGTAADVVPDPDAIPPLARDSNDDYLIALARGHGAECIVSGDRDLLEWEEQHPPVFAPSAFEKLIQ